LAILYRRAALVHMLQSLATIHLATVPESIDNIVTID